MVMYFFFFFFFSSRRRHTRWTGDWTSDVCSSDLEYVAVPLTSGYWSGVCAGTSPSAFGNEIGRASCRERGESSVVAGSLKKKERASCRDADELKELEKINKNKNHRFK